MSFNFPSVYDALFAKSMAKKKYGPKLFDLREELDISYSNYEVLHNEKLKFEREMKKRLRDEKREAYFLGTSVKNPYVAEVIPLTPGGNYDLESTEGYILTAGSQQGLAKGLSEIRVKNKFLMFPPGAYDVKRKVKSESKSKKKIPLFETAPTIRPTDLNEKNIGLFLGKDTQKELFTNERTAKIIFEKREIEKLPFSKIERSRLFGTGN